MQEATDEVSYAYRLARLSRNAAICSVFGRCLRIRVLDSVVTLTFLFRPG